MIRKPRPHLSRPSAMKEKSALRGRWVLSAGTETAPMAFSPISATLGPEHARPAQLAAVQEHAHEAPIVVGRRGKAAAADRRRDREPELRRLQHDLPIHPLAGALLLGYQARSFLLRSPREPDPKVRIRPTQTAGARAYDANRIRCARPEKLKGA